MRFAEYSNPATLIQDIRNGLLAYIGTTPTQSGAIKSKHEGRPLFLGKKYPALTVSFAGFSYSPRTGERSRMPGVVNFEVRFIDVALLKGSSRRGEDRRVVAEKACARAMAEWWQGWADNPRLDGRATEVRLASGDAGDEDSFGNARVDEFDNLLYVIGIDVQVLL